MVDYDFSFSDSENNREVDIEERVFLNNRRIVALNREVFQYVDDSGTQKIAIRRVATADCGCSCSLNSLYMCWRCQRIMCYRHTAIVGCSICMMPGFCFQCLILYQAEENTPPTPVCLSCFEQIRHSFFRNLIVKIWHFIFKRRRKENVPALRDYTNRE